MSGRFILSGGLVVMATHEQPVERCFVEVVGDRIGRVGALADLGGVADATVIDITGCTVLPGLIDTHIHVFHEAQMMRLSEGAAALWGANYLQSALRAGVTTVRDLGAQTEAVFGLKRALSDGYVVGPRLLVSGRSEERRVGQECVSTCRSRW